MITQLARSHDTLLASMRLCHTQDELAKTEKRMLRERRCDPHFHAVRTSVLNREAAWSDEEYPRLRKSCSLAFSKLSVLNLQRGTRPQSGRFGANEVHAAPLSDGLNEEFSVSCKTQISERCPRLYVKSSETAADTCLAWKTGCLSHEQLTRLSHKPG
ncbi:hypothetical protein FKP32DRAFT_1588908 [Trametes sanguinea]|nr:hypothetical protein FKP32DRAFT_1588908 [Trametes sanguinea]